MNIGSFAVYGAGVLTFFTPCILPVIPIYLAALLGPEPPAKGSRTTLLIRAALFSVGFVATFTLLGVLASSLGGLLASWRAVIQLLGGLIVIVFGLRFVGVLRLGFLDRVFRFEESRLKTRFAGINAIVMGVLFAAGWSPCVGPVLGSVLTYAAAMSTSPADGARYLALYGLGLATPLVGVAVFAQAGVQFLRRLRPHLPLFERVVGVVLLALGLGMAGAAGFSLVHERFVAARGSDVAAPGDHGSAFGAAPTVAGSATEPGSHGRPMLVEIVAANCPACKAMRPVVARLAEQCDEHGVSVVAVDIGTRRGRELARRYGVVGVPTFIVFDGSGRPLRTIVGVKSEAELKELVAPVVSRPCPEAAPAPLPEPVAPCQTAVLGATTDGGVGTCDERGM